MLGILFTELIEMLEDRHGLQFAEEIIREARLKNKGAFTAVGYYSLPEMDKLVESLCLKINSSKPEFYHSFGVHMTTALINKYPAFYAKTPDLFSFILKLHDWVAVEIAKLYPQEQRPSFLAKKLNPSAVELVYESKNRLADFIEGIIEGHARFFEEDVSISRTNVAQDGSKVIFLVERNNKA